jgi:Glycosyl hydrolase family 12
MLGGAVVEGKGMSTDQYAKNNVKRNGVSYVVVGNGWGPNWMNHSISWEGTAFTIISLNGSEGSNYEPAAYPAAVCGKYGSIVSGACGLPAATASITSLKTGWRWKANGNDAEYNAAYDIWISAGDTTNLGGYMMVWLREPAGQQPAGTLAEFDVTVPGLPGKWDIWVGKVNNLPIINWVQVEGNDMPEIEFDFMDLVKDAPGRGYTLPGSKILAVAAGFEIWNGPITNLVSEDFYVDVR